MSTFSERSCHANPYSLGILYPRGATVGGSAQLNAMNFALPPESDWNYITELTGDKSWSSDNMRRLFVELEDCTYAPEGTPGHGFDGFIGVRHFAYKPFPKHDN